MVSIRLRVMASVATFVVGVASSCEATAQDATSASENSAQAQALLKFGKAAAAYDIRIVGESTPFTLNSKSIMNWTNPARLGENGAMYLWFHRGRPQVIGSIFTYSWDNRVHDKQEFHSLATTKIESRFGGERVWHPGKPGVEFKPIPQAPVPATTDLRRQLQMKLLSRRFSGRMLDGTAGETALRPVAAPLATYEPKDASCQSGAIFSLAYGTDPEALILIESRKSGDAWQWQYAIARFHYNELSVSVDGKRVWSVPREVAHEMNQRSTVDLRDEVYVSFAPN